MPKAKGPSPTVLTMRYLRKRGVPCAVTERWVKTNTGGFRRDIFGGDLIALTGTVTINVQATSAANHASHVQKSIGLESVRQWLASPHRVFWVMTWKKRPSFKANGERRKVDRWAARVTQLLLVEGEIAEREFILKEE